MSAATLTTAETSAAAFLARLDRLPRTRYIWTLVTLLSAGVDVALILLRRLYS